VLDAVGGGLLVAHQFFKHYGVKCYSRFADGGEGSNPAQRQVSRVRANEACDVRTAARVSKAPPQVEGSAPLEEVEVTLEVVKDLPPPPAGSLGPGEATTAAYVAAVLAARGVTFSVEEKVTTPPSASSPMELGSVASPALPSASPSAVAVATPTTVVAQSPVGDFASSPLTGTPKAAKILKTQTQLGSSSKKGGGDVAQAPGDGRGGGDSDDSDSEDEHPPRSSSKAKKDKKDKKDKKGKKGKSTKSDSDESSGGDSSDSSDGDSSDSDSESGGSRRSSKSSKSSKSAGSKKSRGSQSAEEKIWALEKRVRKQETQNLRRQGRLLALFEDTGCFDLTGSMDGLSKSDLRHIMHARAACTENYLGIDDSKALQKRVDRVIAGVSRLDSEQDGLQSVMGADTYLTGAGGVRIRMSSETKGFARQSSVQTYHRGRILELGAVLAA